MPTRWKRGPDRSVIFGPYTIKVIGETPSGKACRWGLYYNNAPVQHNTTKGRLYAETFDSLSGAKWRAERLFVETPSYYAVIGFYTAEDAARFIARHNTGLSGETINPARVLTAAQMENIK